MRKILALAVAAVLSASTAQAGFSVTLDQTGLGAPTSIGDRFTGAGSSGDLRDLSNLKGKIVIGDSGGFIDGLPYIYGGFQVFLSADSSSPTATATSLVTKTTIRLVNTSTVAQTITLVISDDTFTSPGNGLYLLKNGFNVNSFTAMTDFKTKSSATSDSIDTPWAIWGGTAPEAGSSQAVWNRTGAPSAFALTNTITLTLAVNGVVDFTTTTGVNPLPAPAGLLLAGLGLPLFAGLRRFRKSATTETLAA